MGDITLLQALQEYKEIFLASRNFAQRTRVEYQNDLEDLIRFLWKQDIKQVKDIGLPQIGRYLAELDHRCVAGSTRKRKVVAVRSFLWYLYQARYIRINIGTKIIPPFVEGKPLHYLTRAESDQLCEASANNPRDFAIVQTLLQTGIKLSELTQLSVNDLELPLSGPEVGGNGYLHIRANERKKARIVPLNSEACHALSSYIKIRPSAIAPVLFVNRFGNPLSHRGVEKRIMKYLTNAQISNINVQNLRHTFAIRQLINGVDVNTVQKWLGLADHRSMLGYTSLILERRPGI